MSEAAGEIAAVGFAGFTILAFATCAEGALFALTDLPANQARFIRWLTIGSTIARGRWAALSACLLALFFGVLTVGMVTTSSPSPPLQRLVGLVGVAVEVWWCSRLIGRWRRWRADRGGSLG
jgi:hypothetical protein